MGDKVATIDWVAYIDSYPRAADPNYLIEDVLNTLFTTSIDPSVKVHLKSILLSGQLTDYYWTSAWSCLLYTSDAADERSSVDLGGRRIIKKKTTEDHSDGWALSSMTNTQDSIVQTRNVYQERNI